MSAHRVVMLLRTSNSGDDEGKPLTENKEANGNDEIDLKKGVVALDDHDPNPKLSIDD